MDEANTRKAKPPILSLQLQLLLVCAILILSTAILIIPIMFSQSTKAVDEAVSIVLAKTGTKIAQNVQSYYQVAYLPVALYTECSYYACVDTQRQGTPNETTAEGCRLGESSSARALKIVIFVKPLSVCVELSYDCNCRLIFCIMLIVYL